MLAPRCLESRVTEMSKEMNKELRGVLAQTQEDLRRCRSELINTKKRVTVLEAEVWLFCLLSSSQYMWQLAAARAQVESASLAENSDEANEVCRSLWDPQTLALP